MYIWNNGKIDFNKADDKLTSAVLNNTIQGACPPIGTIVAFHKNFNNAPSIPPGWIECNGQLITDQESPLYNQYTPNLNGENRFLRGNSTSGGTGGSDTHRHYISYLIGLFASLFLNRLTATYPNSLYNWTHKHNVNQYTSYSNNNPKFFNVVWIMRIK